MKWKQVQKTIHRKAQVGMAQESQAKHLPPAPAFP